MVDSEYSLGNYKSLKTSTGAIIKTPQMLKSVSDHLKTKSVCKHEVKKLPHIIRFFSDRNKTQELCHKVFLENGGAVKVVPDCCINKNL